MSVIVKSFTFLALLTFLVLLVECRWRHKKHRPGSTDKHNRSVSDVFAFGNESVRTHIVTPRQKFNYANRTQFIKKGRRWKKQRRKQLVTKRRQKIFRPPAMFCLKNITCNCTYNEETVIINCRDLTNIQSITDVIAETRKRNVSISHIYVRNATFNEFPDDFLAGETIQQVFLNRIHVGQVSPYAFRGIHSLYQIVIYSWNVNDLPYIFHPAGALLVTRLQRTNVSQLGMQLSNITTLQVVSLDHNNLSEIHEDAFENLHFLKRLDLSHNRLAHLSPRTFRHVTHITELELQGNLFNVLSDVLEPICLSIERLIVSYNQLESVKDVLSKSTKNLKILDIGYNKLKTLHADDFKHKFPQLRSLVVAYNSLVTIDPEVFQTLYFLEQIDFRHNSISHIDPVVFNHLKNLIRLRFHSNNITDAKGFFSLAKSLQYLYLDNNNMSNISHSFQDIPQLLHLYLNSNQITFIANNTFINNRRLRFLVMLSNGLSYLEADAFKGLNSIILLSLGKNRIQELNGALLHLQTMQKLWLGLNLLTRLTEEDFPGKLIVREISLNNNQLTDVAGAFRQLKSLFYLNLANNSIRFLTEESVPLHLRLLFIQDNPLECDCRLGWALKRIHRNKLKIIKLTSCHGPDRFKGVQLRWVKTRSLYEWPQNCPEGCSCFCHPNGTGYSILVNCSGGGHSHFPLSFPNGTVSLNMSTNDLAAVPGNLSSLVPSLQNLDLENNNISTLAGVSFPRTMSELRLARNQISIFDATLANHTLAVATLSHNPWLCDCSTSQFRTWLLENSRAVKDINDTTCISGNTQNANFHNRAITSISETELCPIPLALSVIIVIVILGCLLMGTSMFIAYVRYRMPIRVWLYSHGLSCVKEEDLDEDKLFDAFLVFSDKNREMADSVALRLEHSPKPNYRLCLHYRDFILGNYIIDNIRWAVRSSKKIIILLTRNFLEGGWTLEEFKIAHQQMIEEKLNRIILVVVGEHPSAGQIPPDIQSYIDSATYIRWEDPCFWEKFLYAMPKVAMGTKDLETQINYDCIDEEGHLLVMDCL